MKVIKTSDDLIRESKRLQNEFRKQRIYWDVENCLESVRERFDVSDKVFIEARKKVAKNEEKRAEIASEKAHKRLVEHFIEMKDMSKEDIDEHITVERAGEMFYTDEAQEIFDEFYDEEFAKLM